MSIIILYLVISYENYIIQHVCESEDREEVVVCELCESSVVSFNQHMKRNHPGCGRSANRQGYRSNGSYVDGWFGGECGSGNPYYLLCGSCREKYLALKSKSKTSTSERYRRKLWWEVSLGLGNFIRREN